MAMFPVLLYCRVPQEKNTEMEQYLHSFNSRMRLRLLRKQAQVQYSCS